MPDKPRIFSSKPAKAHAKQGGSAPLRDRSAAYQRIRERILADEPLCRYCFSEGRVEPATVLDHKIALGLGGTNDRANLVPACSPCNSAKATAERRFLARGYDAADIGRDPDLAVWLSKAVPTLPLA